METPVSLKAAGGHSLAPDWQDHGEVRVRMGDGGLNRRLAEVIAAIGQDGFDGRLVDLLGAAARLEQMNVVALEEGRVRTLFSWHRSSPAMASFLVGQYVAARHYHRDPTLARLDRAGGRAISLGMVRREQIEDEWYRGFFFEEVRLEGKLSILDQCGTRKFYQNYYFGEGFEGFSSQEIQNLADLAETTSQCILRHHELRRPVLADTPRAAPEAVLRILARRAPALTGRELDVCCRIVAGYSTEAIALDLGIAGNSVATYRKRAYAKLGICSQHQLFLLCLDT